MSSSPSDNFWQQHDRFLKTVLTTELPHDQTSQLSQLAQTDLGLALSIFKQIDFETIIKLEQYVEQIQSLRQNIVKTIANNGRVFIAGCGASGRMAVLLERLWRDRYGNDQVIAVIAGGDAALIRAVESFEDQADYGIKQLQQQGFTDNDLLIATTASGESPFILAQTEYAAKYSTHQPWLIYCNSEQQLLERNPKHCLQLATINNFSLDLGPMALTGSTRLQATTAMLFAIGLASFSDDIAQEIKHFYQALEQTDYLQLEAFIESEAAIYQQSRHIVYQSMSDLGLSVLADITERAPTFNLVPFANRCDKNTQPSSWSTLSVLNTNTNPWRQLLQRPPLCLNWPNFKQTTQDYLLGFNLATPSATTAPTLSITVDKHQLRWQLGQHQASFTLHGLNPLK